MPIPTFVTPLLRTASWLLPKIFDNERDKRGPSVWRKVFMFSNILLNYRKSDIRVSIAYLYRIEVDGDYLLIKGNRHQKFQPVGGVYKYYDSETKYLFTQLGVKPDKDLPIDDASRHDLRVRVPGMKLLALLDWFVSEKGREVSQVREFQEELIDSKLIPESFAQKDPRYLYTVWRPIEMSLHFRVPEILVFQIYEPRFTDEQKKALRQVPSSDKIKWVSEDQIMRLGTNAATKTTPFLVAEHAKYIISNN